MLIKCPNCGSTTQLKVVMGDNLNNIWVGSMNYVNQYLACDCGCEFIRQFVFNGETIIIDKEEEEM